MSVSLVFVPIALALRVAMGKEKYNNWLKSSEVKILTNFNNEAELCKIVKKAGYDVVRFAGCLKTHINGEKSFFFWRVENENFTAVFSEYDSEEDIHNFIRAVEKAAGRKVFNSTKEELKSNVEAPREVNEIPPLPKFTDKMFPTNFKDGKLLYKTLKDYGVNPQMSESGDLVCKVENAELVFHLPADNGVYNVEIKSYGSLNLVYPHLSNIDEEYKRNVQSNTYKNVVKKLKEKQVNIENEEILDDNSIVLTIDTGRLG